MLLSFKILLVGGSGVGKTTLLKTLKHGYFVECSITVGLDFTMHHVRMDDVVCKLIIWDFGGCKNFMQMHWENPHFVEGAHGALLAFDISSYETLLALKDWLRLIRKYNPSNIPIILVGMKADLPKAVSKNKIVKFMKKYQIDDYIETSALNMINVEKPFERIVKIIFERKLAPEEKISPKKIKFIESNETIIT